MTSTTAPAAVQLVRDVNRAMIAFDLALGTAAILRPDAALRAIGHAPPSDDARELFRRNGPIWLTFAAAHVMAATRGSARDWWAVAWLRGTEVATDPLWSRSPGIRRAHNRAGLKVAGAFNLALALGAAHVARTVARPGTPPEPGR
ncbi:hypothetical protein DSM112329_01194 [Paraconexibacter sp. AEG42_29]|uniref:Uncharacterized protein n=1 Tax=Paraconexibacter sp. AEG42_29 TaxID=2997339 RepID=A0AAU7AS83_9ACTN